jgi:4-carboxymuconolactone decarboxylase
VTRRLPGVLVVAITAACSSPQESQMPALSDYPPYVPTVVEATDIPSDIFRDSWARVPVPDRDTLDADGQRAWDVIVNPDSRYSEGPRGPTTPWLYSPLMAEHVFPASTYLRYGTGKDQRLTELTILSTAREVKNQYEWSSHEPLAQRAGLEQQIIDLVRDRGDVEAEVPGLGETERTIIRFAREVISEEKVGSETYAAAERLLGQKGVMDLAGLVGYYGFVNVTLKAFDVQLPPGRERLLPPLW